MVTITTFDNMNYSQRKISVYDRKGECRLEVNDSRLGLPNQELTCGSCGERHPMKCEGMFSGTSFAVVKSQILHLRCIFLSQGILDTLC